MASSRPYSLTFGAVEFSEGELPLYGVLGSSPERVTRGMKHTKRAGVLVPALLLAFFKALASGVVGPYLAVDLLD
jgi:hypothetical protein